MQEASYYRTINNNKVLCELCPHNCYIDNGRRGTCQVRENREGKLYALTYERVCAENIDPIEKKPLYHFLPAKNIYSIGSWGCNLRCDFCQNYSISQHEVPTHHLPVDTIANKALENNSVGVAYTYNEPLIAIEYILESAKKIKNNGGRNILVTNGYINPGPLDDLLPFIDATNIDLKGFNNYFYQKLCGGRLEKVLETIKKVYQQTHVEITLLLIPQQNDDIYALENMGSWIAENCGSNIPIHINAYFPNYQRTTAATSLTELQHAKEILNKYLKFVYLGNTSGKIVNDTFCCNCKKLLVHRQIFSSEIKGLSPSGKCIYCQANNYFVIS